MKSRPRAPALEKIERSRDSIGLAGGGARSGHIHGATDDCGWYAQDDIVHDLDATILYLMGLDHERFIWRHTGRDFFSPASMSTSFTTSLGDADA